LKASTIESELAISTSASLVSSFPGESQRRILILKTAMHNASVSELFKKTLKDSINNYKNFQVLIFNLNKSNIYF
jgi:hypothetical protein